MLIDIKVNLTCFVKINLFNLKTTGEIIRARREKKGILLRELAADLKIDSAILSKVERGERYASKDQIKRIAEILGLDKKELMLFWLSEKIANNIQNEEDALPAIKLAEKRIKYLKYSIAPK